MYSPFLLFMRLNPDETHRQKGEGLIIVDAGGGTIDVSSYHGQGSNFQELAAAQCKRLLKEQLQTLIQFTGQFQGSVFVTSRAKTHITGQ